MVQPIRPQDASGIYQRQLNGADLADGLPRRIDGAAHRDGARRADQVTLSPGAQSFARIMQAVSEQTDTRTEQVEALRERIDSGQYRVDADTIARLLVERGFQS